MAITWDVAGPRRTRFTVYRETWVRGGRTPTRLLTDEGGRCCLGHLARDLGIGDEACLGRTFFPRRSYDGNLDEIPSPPIDRYLRIAESAPFVSVNDNDSISDAEREALLTEMFADGGVDVTFVDGSG